MKWKTLPLENKEVFNESANAKVPEADEMTMEEKNLKFRQMYDKIHNMVRLLQHQRHQSCVLWCVLQFQI